MNEVGFDKALAELYIMHVGYIHSDSKKTVYSSLKIWRGGEIMNNFEYNGSDSVRKPPDVRIFLIFSSSNTF